MKSKPAFAAALGLAGNPYDALLSFQMLCDDELRSIIDDLILALFEYRFAVSHGHRQFITPGLPQEAPSPVPSP